MSFLPSSATRTCRLRRSLASLLAPATLAMIVGHASDAAAYSVDSTVSAPCHEQITLRALRAIRSDFPELTRAPEPSRGEIALIRDVPFDLPSDLRDLVGATLVLGNRDVDVRGNEPDDLDQLAVLHGDPARQREHCLRSPSQDEPNGGPEALSDCRDFITETVQSALEGLGSNGLVDAGRRIEVEVVLDLRGSVVVALPRFWLELGRALHTIQDGFSHTYRTPDQLAVRTVMNYLDSVEDRLVESRDGPPHSSALDECVDLDDFRIRRLSLATDASYDLLRAALEPAPTQTERLARTDMVLNEYLSFDESADCTAANGWCDAPEHDYDVKRGCVCRAAGAGGVGSGALPVVGALAVAAAAAVRRRRQRARFAAPAVAGSLALLLAPRALHAQPPENSPAPNENIAVVEGDRAAPPVVLDTTPDTKQREPFPLGVELAGGGAVLDNAALAASLGLRYRLSSHFLIGADGEFNPWFSTSDRDLRAGTTNIYATGIVRFPLSFHRVNLRSTLQLGISRMNMDLVGVPEGSVGPFVGVNLLGIDYEMTRSFYLIVNPAHIAVPIPQINDVPFAYPQYRFTIGLQIGA
jgi:hypothetical protein